MEKLYYENAYERNFVANIIEVIEEDHQFHIRLDRTYFYPEGGGQPSDVGYIESSPIIYVYEKEDLIYHVTERKPSKFKKVQCEIDWQVRFDYMQQHLGQHILSASFVELFDATTIGFHLSKEYSTIDIDKVIDSDGFKKVEDLANETIANNLTVETLFPTEQELRKLPLRKQVSEKVQGPIRLVKIGDFDLVACCGTHPKSTLEVQLIKIIKVEKYKVGMRIEFLCGKRAIGDYSKKQESLKEVARLLGVNEQDVPARVHHMSSDINDLHSSVRALRSEVICHTVEKMLRDAETIDGIKVIKEVYQNIDLKYVNNIATQLTAYPNVIALFGIEADDKAHLLFAQSKELKLLSMNVLLKDAITLIDGKGGGSDFSAQGGGKNNNNLDSSIAYAYSKVRASIL
ncbi:alanyl-tRNA editing protein [Alkaliphilus oremlandii]|uniref:Alanine--tRNA ligase n=1 Tax=Alkaliphilus oremlandii (strain OhILAs) TaxID=350688 RepID=A8MK80_ALKOO|nr:DHHA1 domain-containing protein [Alkaliphilus oremlandii]ABW20212.1 Threonyl/alanyl tRNA synthetase SAD [Alkaliphilus oremlandii OhILAs]